MKLENKDLLLYGVTDRTWTKDRTLAEQVEESIKGGVTIIQLREKDLAFDEFLAEAIEIKEICRKYNIPFLINDEVDIALKCDADGVHIGQGDMEMRQAREKLGPNKIIGVSAHNLKEAIVAEKNGADYLGVGAVFSTSTKLDANTVSIDTLREICTEVKIPVVAIGGIGKENISQLKGSGISGVAVVSAIYGQENIENSSKELLETTKNALYEVE